MNFVERLTQNARQHNLVCVGYDPMLERIPLDGSAREVIVGYFTQLLESFAADALPGMIKPNSAFFEQYGAEGMQALREVIALAQQRGLLVLLDAKRGDIGTTSEAYARAAFDDLGADAITLSPYLGLDAIRPFLAHEDKGVYVLCRTSNPSAKELQDLLVDGEPLYMKVAERIVAWGTGAVVGATYPEELERIAKYFVDSGKQVPLLIPGVGRQGASVTHTIAILRKVGYNLSLVRINSSSGITYAYEQGQAEDASGAASRALRALLDDTNDV